MPKNIILTGLRANGELHLGNYLGSMLPMVQRQRELQAEDELFMFVADLHSFTTPIDHSILYGNTIQNVRSYIAAGIDPEHPQTTIWRQSHVPAHTELTWILNCFTYFGEVSRMAEFKDKSEKMNNKGVSVGLFNYPVLMAADILLYHPNYIPLGDDQKQHLELTRTIAERFNNSFSENLTDNNHGIFTVPEAWDKQVEFTKREKSPRIRSLKHPEAKMSKSIDDPAGTILMQEDPDTASKKIMGATTDSVQNITFDFDKQPGISNLLQILSSITSSPLHEIIQQWEGKDSYGDLKSAVAEAVSNFLREFQSNFNNTSTEQAEQILGRGEQRAIEISNQTLRQVQVAVGLRTK